MRSPDRQLSRDFRLSEWPCWELASAVEVAQLQQLTRDVLQPARDRWGAIRPTSWRWWRDGCRPRTGDHAAGAVDVVPLAASTREVARWLGEHRHGRFGRVLDEGDHLHITPPGVGDGKVYAMRPDGSLVELELRYGTGRASGGRDWAAAGLLLVALLVAAR